MEQEDLSMIEYYEFKRCPFCGGGALMKQDQQDRFFVECSECGARGPALFSENKAAEAWDKRDKLGVITARDFIRLRALAKEAQAWA